MYKENEKMCFVDISYFCLSEFVVMGFKHKEALVSTSCVVKYQIQASSELLKCTMVLEDLGIFSIFSKESVTVVTGKCYGREKEHQQHQLPEVI